MCADRDESAALTARALRQALMGCVWQAETVHVERKGAFVFRAAAAGRRRGLRLRAVAANAHSCPLGVLEPKGSRGQEQDWRQAWSHLM